MSSGKDGSGNTGHRRQGAIDVTKTYEEVRMANKASAAARKDKKAEEVLATTNTENKDNTTQGIHGVVVETAKGKQLTGHTAAAFTIESEKAENQRRLVEREQEKESGNFVDIEVKEGSEEQGKHRKRKSTGGYMDTFDSGVVLTTDDDGGIAEDERAGKILVDKEEEHPGPHSAQAAADKGKPSGWALGAEE